MKTATVAILALFILYAVWSVKEIGDYKREYTNYKDSVIQSHVVVADTAEVAPVMKSDSIMK